MAAIFIFRTMHLFMQRSFFCSDRPASNCKTEGCFVVWDFFFGLGGVFWFWFGLVFLIQPCRPSCEKTLHSLSRKHWWKSTHLGCWYTVSTLCCSPVIFHTGMLRSGVGQVLKCPWRTVMAAKSLEGEGDPQRQSKHICNSKRKPQELVGDGRFSKYWCCGFPWLWVSRKIHTIIYFVSPSLPVPNPSGGPEHQQSRVGDPPPPPQRPRDKAEAPHATARAATISPTALHGESTAPGGPGSTPRQSREGIIYTPPREPQQIPLTARKAQRFPFRKLPAEQQIHTYPTKCHNYLGWTWICLVRFKKKKKGGGCVENINIFIAFFFLFTHCVFTIN